MMACQGSKTLSGPEGIFNICYGKGAAGADPLVVLRAHQDLQTKAFSQAP